MMIAKNHNIKVISDSAQSPGALYKGKFAGTIADIGGFSLNYHKHIHTGEGGILVTNNDELAEKMRLIRNHAEVVIDSSDKHKLVNMIGHNFRLGEIECAIGIEQLKKLNKIIKNKKQLAEYLTKGLEPLKGLITPVIKKDRDHVFYVYGLKIDSKVVKTSREVICRALEAEVLKYIKNIKISIFCLFIKIKLLMEKVVSHGIQIIVRGI